MKLNDFDFALPDESIARYPASPRDHSRLLVSRRSVSELTHAHFFELGDYLREGDLLVLNDTKVLPARLNGIDPSHRTFEALILEPRPGDPLCWKSLLKPGKKANPGLRIAFPFDVSAVVETANGSFWLHFSGPHLDPHPLAFLEWLSTAGVPPLPPYLKRRATEEDRTSYQTVYASKPGSVAAPTAGLHFTQPLLDELTQLGVDLGTVTLRLGYGTFAPIRSDHVEEHVMHEETYCIPEDIPEKIARTRARGGRVIAVGTTALRALESLAHQGREGTTRLFIRPGYQFRNIDGLLTNFHLPKSSLYVLVAALLGIERAREVYAAGIAEGYRFYSYGDAMLILD